ncbi:Inherit from KOG: E3 ubiquitin- protein ligase [Seminavis robusta]|uniref:Inherit from KOG: E3 ubiquitin- protein ligase n=1 Tax=Seminavis robusta TaxID=568900 RepID=A0A9N8EVU8_9STRA|nr:Inherit from KOG: E3 ubiquitin- protein ligase [Seminavis robusta]|eukprot:Sro2146_g316420.1 Inherit from KOG: E3 ubiquitin- protein ligase (169) ;mRNA; f:7176-7682
MESPMMIDSGEGLRTQVTCNDEVQRDEAPGCRNNQVLQPDSSSLPFGWEERYDPGQQRNFYLDTMTGATQWDRPQGDSSQTTNSLEAASATSLPPGWQEYFSPAHNTHFYVDTTTGLAQWERPVLKQPQQFGDGPMGWDEHFDAAQQRYFYVNTATGASQWERPQYYG